MTVTLGAFPTIEEFRPVPDKAHKKSKVLPFPNKGIALNASSESNQIDGSASSAKRPAVLLEPELRLAVMNIIHYGTYRETWHATHERSYRNVTDDDIQAMLTGAWTLASKPEWDDGHHNWKYRLDGQDLDGDELTLIVTLNMEEQCITVITKF